MSHEQRMARWRLVMGSGSEQMCGGLSAEEQAQDCALGFLYDREYGKGRNVRGRGGREGDGAAGGDRSAGLGESQLTVPDWINQIHTLFPKKTIERLEKDALERYQLDEMVTNPDVLARAQPNQSLLKAVLRTKHLMNQQVLAMAQRLVRSVVQELVEKLARDVRNPFLGSVDRRRRSFLKIAKNFDVETTIRRNLKHYDPQRRRVIIETPFFYSRIRRQTDRWQLIILVDESGSMLDSVIYSAVTAAVFWGINCLKTHLVLFDTSVVDVTADCTDPVETLMKVQLGGGTDIANAMEYGASLVENPRRTIVVLITDFYEGGSARRLLQITKGLVDSGATVLGLAALDDRAEPNYDRELAAHMVQLGAHVGAMTPGELAEWVAEKVR